MSLPPALAARLAKRGLITNATTGKDQIQSKIEEEEEVIAEDYDDASKYNSEFIYDSKVYPTVSGCPQKWNVYHTCCFYCVRHYSNVQKEPSKEIKRKFARILEEYPLVDTTWEKVYEPGLKTYYFWNFETDQVSWWPPLHPKFKISMPAERLRKLLLKEENVKPGSHKSESESSEDDKEDDSNDDSDSEDSSSEEEKKEVPVVPIKKRKQEIVMRNDIDPMDPASYSNIPRGKWSDGLKEARNS